MTKIFLERAEFPLAVRIKVPRQRAGLALRRGFRDDFEVILPVQLIDDPLSGIPAEPKPDLLKTERAVLVGVLPDEHTHRVVLRRVALNRHRDALTRLGEGRHGHVRR